MGTGRALTLACAAAAASCGVAGDAPVPHECAVQPARTSGQKAFPTAEGFGKFARGGRGGAVYAVTNLDDSGPGSLRACAEAEGPRTCVFRVSGTIAVDSWINVQNPYLTIAGQTSPGGIAIRLGASTNTPLLIQTHDVVIRYIRLRPGPSRVRSENVDTIQISGGAHDVILDHLSTSWPTDEGINIVGDGHLRRTCYDTRNVTVQWSILSEGLNRANRGPHSRGTYFGYGARDISFHHNLIANNYRRNPLLNTRGQFDLIDNVIYNSARYNAEFYTRFGDLFVNAVGNVAVRGPSAPAEAQLYMFNYFRDAPGIFGIYLKDNLDWRRARPGSSERLALDPGSWEHIAAQAFGRLSLAPEAITGPAEAYEDVLRDAGATHPRDAADQRLIADIRRCRGSIINDPADVGGWPMLAGPPAPPDRDGDGIPDAWETGHGLSPDDPTDGSRVAGGSGYTNLEVYLETLTVEAGQRPAAAALDTTCGQPTPAPVPPPLVEISATPTTVAPGEVVTLRWSGVRVRACKGWGTPLPPRGAHIVNPTKTVTYEIHCTGAAGSDAIDAATVTVREPIKG